MSMLIARPGDTEAEALVAEGCAAVPKGPRVQWSAATLTGMIGLLCLGLSIFGFADDKPVLAAVFSLVVAVLGLGLALSFLDVAWRLRRKNACEHNQRLDDFIATGRIFEVPPALLEIFDIEVARLEIIDFEVTKEWELTNFDVAEIIANHYDQFITLGDPDKLDNGIDVILTYDAVTEALTPIVEQQHTARRKRVHDAMERGSDWKAAQVRRIHGL